jgi:LytS/YehU family sensor histidine kinase
MEDTLFLVGIFRSMLFFAWSMLYFWIKALHEARERELRLSRAETRQREAELQMLRAQINPHFLFNSLNTVIAGLGREQVVLQSVVQGLADYLRYALAHRDANRVPLGEEFDAIVNYLTVEKARFGDDLQIETALDEELRATLVPGVLLQPLVENALKHGWHSAEPPLRLRLAVRRGGSRNLEIEVANTGEWIDPNAARRDGVGGTGLENIRRRLALLYPGRHAFEVAGQDGWVVARISLSETNGTLL